MHKVLLNENFDYESLYDASEKVEDALSEDYNDVWKTIPCDEYGYAKGTFNITITWTPEEE